MKRDEEIQWSAWCPLCHRTVAEADTEPVVRAAWFVHAEEEHPSMSRLVEVGA